MTAKMAVKGADVVKALFKMGVMATINQVIDHDTAVLVVEELGHKAVKAEEKTAETTLSKVEVQGDRETRPPVVTIMGHVDHRRVSRADRQGRDQLPRHAGPRRVYFDARARREAHRHRRARRRRR
jgi:translation initiation factor IF-2